MLRAVLDANVYVSAFLKPSGPAGRILRKFLDRGNFELVLSMEILDELSRAPGYSRVRKYLSLTDDEIEVRVAALGVLAQLVPGELQVRVVHDDADDDKYLAAALEGQAEYLVSGDRHLQSVGEYEGVRVVTPRAFLKLIQEG